MIIDKRTLKKQIAEGGEGLIYDYGTDVLKIYKDTINKPLREEKLKILLNIKVNERIIMPKDLIYDKSGNFLGFSMRKIQGETFKNLSSKKFLNIHGITSKNICNMLIQLKNYIKELHNNNIVIGDLNEKNVIFDSQLNVFLIDIDNCTIDKYRSEVCMETFRDPLLVGNNFRKENDMYAFAILVFKLFTRIHPFGGTTNPEMNILNRMQNKISVIDKTNITIPSIVEDWKSLSPNFIQSHKSFFHPIL
jgi:serine/threonine protein kinase